MFRAEPWDQVIFCGNRCEQNTSVVASVGMWLGMLLFLTLTTCDKKWIVMKGEIYIIYILKTQSYPRRVEV